MRNGPLTGAYEYVDGEGETFKGQLVDGLPHGEGLRTNLEKGFMRGTFERGVFRKGEARWVIDGYHHAGAFVDGLVWTGRGRRPIGGGVEEGMFQEGKLHGVGERRVGARALVGTFMKGEFREGEGWLDALSLDPQGKIGWPFEEGWEYQGRIKEGAPNGNGKLVDRNQKVIAQGVFSGWRLMEGNGKLQRDENILQGTFKDGELQGLGAMAFGDGGFAVGTFEKGKLVEGKVVRDWRMSSGTFGESFKLSGKGKVAYLPLKRLASGVAGVVPPQIEDWRKRCLEGTRLAELLEEMRAGAETGFEEGDFADGLLHGEGESYVGGVYRKGHFKTGRLHGDGKRITRDRVVEEGRFLEDVWVGVDPHKPNPWANLKSVELEDGLRFWGTAWPTGKGRLVYNEHLFEEGDFAEGRLRDGLRVAVFLRVADFQFKVRDGLQTGEVIARNDCLTIVGRMKRMRWSKVDAIFDHKALLPCPSWVADPTKLMDAPPGLSFRWPLAVASLGKLDDKGQCSGFVVTSAGVLYKGTFGSLTDNDVQFVSGEVRFWDVVVEVKEKKVVGAKLDPQGKQDYFPPQQSAKAVSRVLVEGLVVKAGWFLNDSSDWEGIRIRLDYSWSIRLGGTWIGKFTDDELNGIGVLANFFWLHVGNFFKGSWQGQGTRINNDYLHAGHFDLIYKKGTFWRGKTTGKLNHRQPGMWEDCIWNHPSVSVRVQRKSEDDPHTPLLTEEERKKINSLMRPGHWQPGDFEVRDGGEIVATDSLDGAASGGFRVVSDDGYLFEGTLQDNEDLAIADYYGWSSRCLVDGRLFAEGKFDGEGEIEEGVRLWPDGWVEVGSFKLGFGILPNKS